MARRIYSKKMIFGLEDELLKRVSTDAIMGAMSDVEALVRYIKWMREKLLI